MMTTARRIAGVVGLAWFGVVAVLLAGLIALRLAGGQVDLIQSNSMAPAVPIDSVAITMPVDPADLQVDDVITFENGADLLVMHRVVEILETDDVRRFRTKGDNNRTTDPLLLHEVGVQRKLWFSVGGLGFVARALQPPGGLLWLAVVPAALIAFGRWRPRDEDPVVDVRDDEAAGGTAAGDVDTVDRPEGPPVAAMMTASGVADFS